MKSWLSSIAVIAVIAATLASVQVADAQTVCALPPLNPPGYFTPPFTRDLQYSPGSAPPTGNDVRVLQFLLNRVLQTNVTVDGSYGPTTEQQVKDAEKTLGLTVDGIAGPQLYHALIVCFSADGYVDDGKAPSARGAMYKVYIPVHTNRSIETTAKLLNADGEVAFTFTVRTHGQNNQFGDQLNQFAPDGITPTGLSEFDLNSPEDDPKDFGPYPVNRATNGIAGNTGLLISNVRDGILLHTGEWAGWNASMPMPNSHGCIHAHPTEIEKVWKTLVSWGVQVRQNTNGKLPYPYKSQGLLSIELVNDDGTPVHRPVRGGNEPVEIIRKL